MADCTRTGKRTRSLKCPFPPCGTPRCAERAIGKPDGPRRRHAAAGVRLTSGPTASGSGCNDTSSAAPTVMTALSAITGR